MFFELHDSRRSQEVLDKLNSAINAMTPLLRKSSPLTLKDICQLERCAKGQQDFLSELVVLIGNRFEVDVCSLYLLDPELPDIWLAATAGLRQACVGKLRMALWQGLAGLVVQQRRTVMVPKAAEHPRFKYFREAEEDAYQSFLGAPVEHQGDFKGVLVIQTVSAESFGEGEVELFQQAAGMIAPAIACLTFDGR